MKNGETETKEYYSSTITRLHHPPRLPQRLKARPASTRSVTSQNNCGSLRKRSRSVFL